jgi:hypothetical protein
MSIISFELTVNMIKSGKYKQSDVTVRSRYLPRFMFP